MAGVDDVTPEVRIEGGDEVVAEFQKMAASAVDSFAKIAKAAEGMGELGKHVEHGAESGKKALGELAVVGVEAFQKILEAALTGDIAPIMGMMFGKVTQAITETIEKVVEFVEAQASVMETMSSLAEATGMSLSQLEGLKDAFASVGVSTNGFERSIGRLAITIGNEWSQIQQAVRTSSDQQTGAMLHITETVFGVQKAYHSLSDAIDQTSRQAAHSAINIQQASIGLREAVSALADFGMKSQQNTLSLEGATLNLRRAQLNLMKDQGYDTTAAEKELKLEADKLAVKEAELRLQEAQAKKHKEALELEKLNLDLVKARQEAQDAAAKAIEDAVHASDRLKEAQLAIQKAQLAQREASEKAHEMDLKDIPAIAKEIDNVVAGYKTWDQVMNHAEISAQNLTKAVILAAAGGGQQPPQALDVFKEMVTLFANMGDGADAAQKKIEMVQHTMGAGFRAGQASAAQIVAVINRFGTDTLGAQKAMEQLFESTEKFSKVKFGGVDLEDSRKSLLEFNSAFARLEALLDQVKSRFAAIMAEPLTKLFNEMRESLESNEGALHKFVEGAANVTQWVVKMVQAFAESTTLRAFGELLVRVVSFALDVAEAFGQVVGAIGKLIGMDSAAKFFANMTYAIDLLKLSLDGLRLILAGVLIGFGLLAAAADKAKSMLPGQTAKTWEQAKADSPALQAGNKMADSANEDIKRDMKALEEAGKRLQDGAEGEKKASETHQGAADQHKAAAEKHSSAAERTDSAAQNLTKAADAGTSAAGRLDGAGTKLDSAGTALQQAAAALAGKGGKGEAPTGAAEGGHIRGPGTGTSDSIPARLSDGEFVVRSAAVEHYGVPLFSALNSLAMGAPRAFAMGGPVSVRGASLPGGPGGGPTSILNLTIDGNHFNGLKAPEHVASKLKSYAVTRQTASAGKTPSWLR
jgi:hypothetical protein